MLNVTLEIYFTNHLNKKIKLNDFIIDVEDGVFSIQNKKIYSSLVFVTHDVYFSPDIVGDGIERIELIYKIEGDLSYSGAEKFMIEDIEYLENENIKVYSKTKGYKYTKEKLNKIIPANSVKELITSLLADLTIDFSKFSDIPLLFDYEIENKTAEDVINEISKITDFDYYYFNGTLYIEDKRVINPEDNALFRFNEIEHITDFSTTYTKDNVINRVEINLEDEEIISTPTIALEIKNSPQCCSPDEVIIYTDDSGNTYKINPVNAFFVVYYSPLIATPKINLPAKKGERVLIETFKLNNDNFVKLTGGVKELIAVEGVENYKAVDNILMFDKVEKGELKVTYKTDCLYGTIEHSKYPKTINFYITHFNQVIDYDHKIELNGYYPIPFDFTLNLCTDWGIDYIDAINKNVTISKKDGDVFVELGEFTSNAFGELEFTISEYGTYKFEIQGQEPLYLDWYINNKKIYMDEVSE